MISSRRIPVILCCIAIIAILVLANDCVMASGKKKFLKGFILGALLSKNHYPIVYSMPSHGHGGGHGYGW